MHFFHHIILLTFSLLTLTSAWIGIGSRKQNTITSNTNTNANTALAAITALHSEHKERMALHAKTMLPLTTSLNKLLASLHTYADTNTNTGTDKITNNKQNKNVELHLSTLLKFVTSEVAQEDYDLDILRAVLLQHGGSLEERLRESRGNMKVLEVARWMLGRMEKETEELRVWNEGFRKRVEEVKEAFEEGRGERKGRVVRA